MVRYITAQGDTWDSIALRFYNDEDLMWVLIDANPQYRHLAVFSANCELAVPDVPRVIRNNAPSWWG